MLLGQSRVFFAISKDGLLPKRTFGELHPQFRTPYRANILIGLVVSLISAFTPIDSISKMVNIGTLLAFVMVCIAVWVMRKKEPDRPRPFKAPAIWFVAPMGVIFNPRAAQPSAPSWTTPCPAVRASAPLPTSPPLTDATVRTTTP